MNRATEITKRIDALEEAAMFEEWKQSVAKAVPREYGKFCRML